MNIAELVDQWERTAKGRMAGSHYSLALDVESAARLEALAEMYPKRTVEELLGELLGAALEAVEGSFPYERGNQVIATDEQGDPIYEDIGPTPRFLSLSRKHLQRLLESRGDEG